MIKNRKPPRRRSPKREAALKSELGFLPGSTVTGPRKRPKPKNAKRKASEFARCYDSVERVNFVKWLPSVVTGLGACENVHVRGDGAGRKGSYIWIVPLRPEEHRELHRWGKASFESFYSIDLDAAAASVQREWLNYVDRGDARYRASVGED